MTDLLPLVLQNHPWSPLAGLSDSGSRGQKTDEDRVIPDWNPTRPLRSCFLLPKREVAKILSFGVYSNIQSLKIFYFVAYYGRHLVHWFLECLHSLLPSLVWLLPVCLDSWTWHSRFLCHIALYSIGPCFYHQPHPQLGFVFANTQVKIKSNISCLGDIIANKLIER